MDQIITELYEIERDIKQNAPSYSESEVLFYATSVARNSTQYWAKNWGKWKLVLLSDISVVYTPNDIDGTGFMTRGNSDDGNDESILKGFADLPEGYYAHPTDRALFIYVSRWQEVVLLPCPDGLHFNPLLCACDWPNNVADIYNKNDNEDDFDWGVTVGADVGGAIGGALGGWIGSLVGAVGASAGAALGQIF